MLILLCSAEVCSMFINKILTEYLSVVHDFSYWLNLYTIEKVLNTENSARSAFFTVYRRIFTFTSGNKLTTKISYCWPVHTSRTSMDIRDLEHSGRYIGLAGDRSMSKVNVNNKTKYGYKWKKRRPCWINLVFLNLCCTQYAGGLPWIYRKIKFSLRCRGFLYSMLNK